MEKETLSKTLRHELEKVEKVDVKMGDVDDDIDNDTSWLEEQEKLENIHEVYYREPMKSIQCYFLYINKNNDVFNIVPHKLPIVSDKSIVSFETLSKLNESSQHLFSIEDVLLYNVTMEPQQIQSFSNIFLDSSSGSFSQYGFLKSGLVGKDILIPPSIFIFHNVNSIIVLLREKKEPVLKSIIKKREGGGTGTGSGGGGGKSTKKVRIHPSVKIPKHRYTRKVDSE